MLPTELHKYVKNIDGIDFFMHPLMCSPYFHSEIEDDHITKVINNLSALTDKKMKSKNFIAYLSMHSRPFRLEALINCLPKTNDAKNIWEMIDYVWTDSESPSTNLKMWEYIFNYSSASPTLNSKSFKALPQELTLYRGSDSCGLSWTDNKQVAEYFANRFDNHQEVKCIKIDKSKIIHFTDSRGESEFIILTKYTKQFY